MLFFVSHFMEGYLPKFTSQDKFKSLSSLNIYIHIFTFLLDIDKNIHINFIVFLLIKFSSQIYLYLLLLLMKVCMLVCLYETNLISDAICLKFIALYEFLTFIFSTFSSTLFFFLQGHAHMRF